MTWTPINNPTALHPAAHAAWCLPFANAVLVKLWRLRDCGDGHMAGEDVYELRQSGRHPYTFAPAAEGDDEAQTAAERLLAAMATDGRER